MTLTRRTQAEQKDAIHRIISTFPPVFKLTGHGNDLFRLSPEASFFPDADSPLDAVQLYLQVNRDGSWFDFSRDTATVICQRLVLLPPPVPPAAEPNPDDAIDSHGQLEYVDCRPTDDGYVNIAAALISSLAANNDAAGKQLAGLVEVLFYLGSVDARAQHKAALIAKLNRMGVAL